MYKETSSRSVAKAISYRITGSLTTVLIAYFLTGRVSVALTIAGLDVVVKIGVYFLHERLWDKIHFGKKEIKPFVVWITGLAASGKTSIAKLVTERLKTMNYHVEHLDGDTVRQLFPATGFTRPEVEEHIKRVGHLASRLEQNGVFVVASFISPFNESREFIRDLCGNFILVHLSTPAEECEKRDTRGLYARARRGEIRHFAGVDLEYESPVDAHVVLDTSRLSLDAAVDRIMAELNKHIAR